MSDLVYFGFNYSLKVRFFNITLTWTLPLPTLIYNYEISCIVSIVGVPYITEDYLMKKTILIVVTAMLLLVNTANAQAVSNIQTQQKGTHVKTKLSTAEGQQIKRAVDKYSKLYNVDKTLIHAVIMTESMYNPRAVSSQGCSGLMQLAPSTFRARQVGSNIYDIEQNVHGGTKYLAGLLARYNGDVPRALGAYNMGGGNIHKGRPLPTQAQRYVNKVYYHKQIVSQITL